MVWAVAAVRPRRLRAHARPRLSRLPNRSSRPPTSPHRARGVAAQALDSLYGHLASNEMIGGTEEEAMPGQSGEFYPYVFLTLPTEPQLA